MRGDGGKTTNTMETTVKNYGELWFHSKAITNIISLENVRDKLRVRYDSDGDSIFTVHKPNGMLVRFVMHSDVLHYHDT